MKIQLKCNNCETELEIVENTLLFSEEKRLESAHCPVCENEVYTGKTDGWYYVQTTENIKKEITENCIYPMA
jgi:CRISPR/Cas system-associated protein Csx1